MPVHFRVRYSISNMSLAGDEAIAFRVGGPRKIEVELELEVSSIEGVGPRVIVTAKGAVSEPDQVVVEAFQALTDNHLPKPWQGASEWPWSDHIRMDGSFSEGYLPPLIAMPRPFQGFLGDVYSELRDAARRTVRLLRWRTDAAGPSEPFAGLGDEWSLDGEVFHPAPTSMSGTAEIVKPLQATASVYADVMSMLNDQSNEPLGHLLLREAWQERHASRRGALVIGVAAMEVGVKEFVSRQAPEAAWLVEHTPSPPLVRMMSELIPSIVIETPPPREFPAETLKLVEWGVGIRNHIVHSPRDRRVSYSKLDDLLKAVRDALYLLDYWSGSAWALAHVRAGHPTS